MIKIEAIKPGVLQDSRGEKTIEVTLTSQGFEAKASVPCGKSKGDYEAFCHTVEYSKKLIEDLEPRILKEQFKDQIDFDNYLLNLDGTKNKEKLGVNVTLSLSIAFLRLYSLVNNLEVHQTVSNLSNSKITKFPLLFFNLINGGLHVERSYCPLPFQEYMIIPKTDSPKESLDIVFKFIEKLKQGLIEIGLGIKYGDEGGFVITGEDPEIGFQHFQDVIKNDKELFLNKVYFGLDVASSSLWNQDNNLYGWDNGFVQCTWNNEQLSGIYQLLAKRYPLLSIEDPFHQDSWKEWSKLNQTIGGKVWLVADDLTVTNVERIKKAAKEKSANAILIKPNQIGTVSETLDAVKLARTFGWKIVVSHRSGETVDSFIADFAFGIGADGLKSGSPLQEERLAKYRRLLQIEDSLN
jgi:enolase